MYRITGRFPAQERADVSSMSRSEDVAARRDTPRGNRRPVGGDAKRIARIKYSYQSFGFDYLNYGVAGSRIRPQVIDK